VTAGELHRALEAARAGTRRMSLPAVWNVFCACAPHLRGHPEARAELARHLTALAEDGALRLPRSSRLYDRAQVPPLPHWIELGTAAESPSARARAANLPWHPALDFVRRLPRMSERDLEDLICVQRFLAEGGDAPILTMRERSLRVFGDDKRLESLARGPLFREGRLSHALLRCRPVRLPFVFRDFEHGDEALIIENKDTFHSACAARSSLPHSRMRWIVFGHGHTIHAAIESMLEWSAPPGRILYFGDIDRRGLEIPQALAEIVVALRGLPALECAARFYERLLANAKNSRRQLAGGKATEEEARAIAAWLPAPLAEAAAVVLIRGSRLPQEWVVASDFESLLGGA
jgi:hypothetical protein